MKGIGIVWLSKTDLTNINSGEGESNLIDVKKYKTEGKEFPYVSGQAMRFYLKEAIRRNLDDKEYMCVPNEKGETCGNIKKCIGCDLFGFMLTTKGEKRGEGGASVRVSPIKVSPAMGLLPFDENSTLDFLTRKHRKDTGEMEGDIVNVEIGTNIYKVGMSIDIKRIGAEEEIGEDRQIRIKDFVEKEKKIQRIKKALEAIRYLTDYSKQARLLTDFSPDIILISLQNIYSHRIQKAFALNPQTLEIDTNRLKAISEEVLEYSSNIYFGILPGIVKNEDDVRRTMESIDIPVTTPKEAISAAVENIQL